MNRIDVSMKTNLNAFVSLFFDSSNQFENQTFIESITISKTDLKRITKQNIKQSFDNVLSIDDLID